MYGHPSAGEYHVTRDHYFQGYAGHAEITPALEAAADAWCEKVNRFLDRAVAAGVPLQRNRVTGTMISGERNGGWRPSECPIGARFSKHKTAHGGDLFDPNRYIASWSLSDEGAAAMEEIGLWAERFEWTPGWAHLQDIAAGTPPRPAVRFFIPDSSPQKAPKPELWAQIKARLDNQA